jgi:acetolactate synthase small subunit
MKCLTFIGFLLPFGSIAQQKLDARLEHVTVFVNGAQVMRTATATLPAGKSEVILRGLTPSLDPQSVTVKGDGDFTILSVRAQLNYLEEQRRKDTIVTLENESSQLVKQLEDAQNKIAVLKQEEDILNHNKAQIIGIQNNPNKTDDLKALLDFQKARLTDVLTQKTETNRFVVKTQQRRTQITQQLSELNVRKNTTTAEVVISIFTKNAIFGRFLLEYIVPNSSWYPIYDLRVQDVNTPMTAQMKGKVRQNSGEDWKDVKLTLSTGEPKRTGVKPELGTWFLGTGGASTFSGRQINVLSDFQTQRRANQQNKISGLVRDASGEGIPANIIIAGTTRGTMADADGKFDLDIQPNDKFLVVSSVGYNSQNIPIANNGTFVDVQLKESEALNEVVVTGYAAKKNTAAFLQGEAAGLSMSKDKKMRSESKSVALNVSESTHSTSVTYDIELPYTVPTDNKEYQVEIKEMSLAAFYEYSCAPKLETDVFLTAHLTDWEQYNLPEGEANLYFEGTFLGKSVLKTQSTEDTLKISMGRDKNIVVKRVKQKELTTKKGIFSGKKTESRTYEIVVKNKKGIAISLNIEDQVPIATDKQIEVQYAFSDNPVVDKNTGHLTWKLQLKPLEDRKLQISYTVKHPAEWRVNMD